MQTLVFQLQGPMAAWGESAVGGYRPSASYPGKSALAGLLGAAMGLRREEDASQLHALHDLYRFAVAIKEEGRLLRDYHTSQVASQSALKKRPHASRRDELNVPQEDVNTILSTRDYRSNGNWLVVYLGRKSCPPAAPLFPHVVEVETVHQAFARFDALLQQAWVTAGNPEQATTPIRKLAWEDGMSMGVEHDLSTWRKDRLIHRGNWQFGDRMELIATMDLEQED